MIEGQRKLVEVEVEVEAEAVVDSRIFRKEIGSLVTSVVFSATEQGSVRQKWLMLLIFLEMNDRGWTTAMLSTYL